MRSLITAVGLMALAAGLASAQGQNNALTRKESADGWMLLFDGKSLNGWQGHVDMGERARFPSDVVAELKVKRTEAAKEHWTPQRMRNAKEKPLLYADPNEIQRVPK